MWTVPVNIILPVEKWNFWNRHIKKVIDWLPLEEDSEAGINSGNVGIRYTGPARVWLNPTSVMAEK